MDPFDNTIKYPKNKLNQEIMHHPKIILHDNLPHKIDDIIFDETWKYNNGNPIIYSTDSNNVIPTKQNKQSQVDCCNGNYWCYYFYCLSFDFSGCSDCSDCSDCGSCDCDCNGCGNCDCNGCGSCGS